MKYIGEHREKNDATSIPPKITTDFMLIMYFSLAVFITIQLKHVPIQVRMIFRLNFIRFYQELNDLNENASAIKEKKIFVSHFTQ